MRVSFTLDRTRVTGVELVDGWGLTDLDERVLRLEATEDRRPTATLIEPTADQSVLATAVLPVQARATDDVAVQRLTVEVQHPTRDSSPPTSDETGSDPAATQSGADATPVGIDAALTRQTLAQRTGRQATLEAQVDLDLARLPLRVGDTVTVLAYSEDGYVLGERTHPPTEATPRRLTIIDQATLIQQVRSELAGVRQQAVRLELRQDQLQRRAADRPGPRAAEQARMTQRLEGQTQQLRRLQQRLALNRLAEPVLDELIQQADDLVEAATQSSAAAREALQRQADTPQAEAQISPSPEAQASADRAAAEQQQVREKLEALARLLDQGQDTLGLKLELTRLRTEQEALARDTRELMPRTLGRPLEDLPADTQETLRELAQRQETLRQQARDAVANLQNAAEALARQDDSEPNADANRAAAQAMAEAAEIAQRQGLDPQMQQAQEGLDQNQLSQAGGAQSQTLDTLEQMMQQLGEQDQLRQELLRRRLLALAERLQKLIEGQTLANASWADLNDAGLIEAAGEQSRLWVLTIAAQTEAEADEKTVDVAPIIGQAVEAQAAALMALRAAGSAGADAGGRVALQRLEAALEKVRALQDENQRDETSQQRAELRADYLALAEQQIDLRQRTQDLLAPENAAPPPGEADPVNPADPLR